MVGRHPLEVNIGVRVPDRQLGSGDTAHNLVKLFC